MLPVDKAPRETISRLSGVILHLKIIIGRWKLEDWHVYRYTEHRDAKTGGKKHRWMMWDRVL